MMTNPLFEKEEEQKRTHADATRVVCCIQRVSFDSCFLFLFCLAVSTVSFVLSASTVSVGKHQSAWEEGKMEGRRDAAASSFLPSALPCGGFVVVVILCVFIFARLHDVE